MKNKNSFLIVAIAIALIACVMLLLVNVFELNLIKHHDIQLGELSVKYYGDFNKVKIIKIYDGSIRKGTFDLSVDKNILLNSNEYSPYFDDINEDGHEDILIPHSKDAADTPRYAVYLWNNQIKMFENVPFMVDIANLSKGDESNYFSLVSLHKTIFEEQKNIPEVYEYHKINTEYQIVNEKICLVKNYTLIYYSETDAYCYVKTDYDPENGEIISCIEDWIDEKEASEIKFYN